MSNTNRQRIIAKINANPDKALFLAYHYAMLASLHCKDNNTFNKMELINQSYVTASNVLKDLAMEGAKFYLTAALAMVSAEQNAAPEIVKDENKNRIGEASKAWEIEKSD